MSHVLFRYGLSDYEAAVDERLKIDLLLQTGLLRDVILVIRKKRVSIRMNVLGAACYQPDSNQLKFASILQAFKFVIFQQGRVEFDPGWTAMFVVLMCVPVLYADLVGVHIPSFKGPSLVNPRRRWVKDTHRH